MLNYYFRLALKSMRRNPVLSGLMVVALGLGIGAFMTTFTVYYLMSGDPIPHKSSVLYRVQLDNWDPNEPPTEGPKDVQPQLTWSDGQYLMNNPTPALRQVQMYGGSGVVQPEQDDIPPFRSTVRVTYGSFFEMFDVPFLFGQAWDRMADDERRRVIVLNRKQNDQLFNGENSVGRQLTMNATVFEVVGVVDDWQPTPLFYHVEMGRFTDTEDFFIPFNTGIDLFVQPVGNVNCWQAPDGSGLEAFLRSECVWNQFWAELPDAETAAAYKDFLDNYVREQKQMGRFPRPLNTFISNVMEWMDVQEVVSRDNRVLVRLSFLFLLVCILNTIGLLLAKFLGKGPEVALRRAMGASRSAVFLQNLIEVGTIGVLGGILGTGLAWLGLRLIENLYRGYQHLVQLDVSMLLMALSLAVLASIAAGLYPVWRVSRLAPAGLLKTQ